MTNIDLMQFWCVLMPLVILFYALIFASIYWIFKEIWRH